MASFFGGLIGACCVLIAVYVTNNHALVITSSSMNEVVNSLHTRINDFYIFAGIVITLLLAINVGVYVKADDEIEKHFQAKFGEYEARIKKLLELSKEDLEHSNISQSKHKKHGNKSKNN